MLLLLICCQEPSPTPEEKPKIALPSKPIVSITPEMPSASDDLYCSVQEEPAVTYHYSWISNNRTIQSEGSTLRANDTEWGDIWSCIVTPENAAGMGETEREQVEITNECSRLELYHGDLFINSQEDIQLLCRYYNSVSGDLWIQGGYDLSSLSCLCEIQGNLYISMTDELVGNQHLSKLQNISGDLTVFETDNLISLQFPNLSNIGDDLQIISSSLESISIPELQQIGGELYIENNSNFNLLHIPENRSIQAAFSLINNPNLETITSHLEYIGGDINVYDNSSLQYFPSLFLQEINGSLQLHRNDVLQLLDFPELRLLKEGITINKMSSLTAINVPSISQIDEGISIQQNPLLQEVKLDSLVEVHTFFKIEHNENLKIIDVSELKMVREDMYLRNLPKLEELSMQIQTVLGDFRIQNLEIITEIPLIHLEQVGNSFYFDQNLLVSALEIPNVIEFSSDVSIVGNDSMRFIFMPPLNSIGGDLDIGYNLSLSELSIEVNTVAGDITVESNSMLDSIDFVDLYALYGNINVLSNPLLLTLNVSELTNIGDSVSLIDNEALSSINFGAVIQIQGDLWLQLLPSLQNITGFNNLESIGSNFRLIELPVFQDISIPFLSTIGNDLVIDQASSITNLDSLTSIDTIGGHLEIKNNVALQNIGALMNLWVVGGDFRIIDNQLLPNSQIQELIDHLLLNQFTGNIVVSGNLEN
jgi:hypothetical protein